MKHLTAGWQKLAKTPPQWLYHFTSTMHLPAIIQSGNLRLTESNIEISGAGPGVVWLTETTDPGGNGLTTGFKDQVRFTIPANSLRGYLHWWPEWSREQGIEEFWYEALHAASGGGHPDNWWVATAPIPLFICDIEIKQGTSWVPMPEHTAAKTAAMDPKRLGQCYPLSYRYATSHPDWTLIHGTIQGMGNPRIGHGFCESPDGTEIWEPATDEVWSKDAFDAFFKPTYDHRFDYEQVMVNSIKYRHYGPWDGTV